MAKFATHASGAIWWPILQLMQVAPFVGQICIGILFSWRDNSSFRCFTLGPLCLWQCLKMISLCKRLISALGGWSKKCTKTKTDGSTFPRQFWNLRWSIVGGRSGLLQIIGQIGFQSYLWCILLPSYGSLSLLERKPLDWDQNDCDTCFDGIGLIKLSPCGNNKHKVWHKKTF